MVMAHRPDSHLGSSPDDREAGGCRQTQMPRSSLLAGMRIAEALIVGEVPLRKQGQAVRRVQDSQVDCNSLSTQGFKSFKDQTCGLLDLAVCGKPAKAQAYGGVGLLRAEAEGAEHVRRLGNAGRAGCTRGHRNPWLEHSENVLSRKSVKPQVGVAGVSQVTHRSIDYYRMAAAFHHLNERVALSSNARSLAHALCRTPDLRRRHPRPRS